MPVNFLEIQTQVKEMGRQAPLQDERRRRLGEEAARLMDDCAANPAELQRRIEAARSANAGLRCAIPGEEGVLASFPAPPLPADQVVLAADGSQVNPDRSDPVEFGLINIGAIRLCPGRALTPQESVHTQLLYGDTLHTNQGMLTEEIVALRRDLNERQMLAELAIAESEPLVTLTDGPLELYREPKNSAEFRDLFKKYLEVLRRLAGMKVATAGYVDKPQSDLVVRMLELMLLAEDELGQAGRLRPLRPLRDVDLFRWRLQPAERSPVFAIQSQTAKEFEDELALHFFYLNVGRPDHPYLARVEIPAWVAGSEDLLSRLHAVLVGQCAQTGSQPYPYAIHRAHEVAVVSRPEKQQLLAMLALELRRQGAAVGEASYKQAHKDQLGSRTRYKV